jgi:hypothetical protein
VTIRQPYEGLHKKLSADFPQQLLVIRISAVKFQSHLAQLTPPRNYGKGTKFPAFPCHGKFALLVNLEGWGKLQQASQDAQVFYHHIDGCGHPRQMDAGFRVG